MIYMNQWDKLTKEINEKREIKDNAEIASFLQADAEVIILCKRRKIYENEIEFHEMEINRL